MGSEIAQRLLAHRFAVCGWDIQKAQREAAQRNGATIAESGSALLRDCRRVVLSLPTHEIVLELLRSGPLASGQTIIDTTTGSAEAAERMAEHCQRAGVEYIDATVSGSSAQLRSGTAVLLVGASQAAFISAKEILLALSPKLFHVGPAGAGARMKLVTNLVLGLNRAALAEGLAFAQRQGLDLTLTLNLFRETLAYSRIMDTKGEKMIQEDFTPQARLSQHLKDVRLMLEAAESSGMELPLTQTHRQILERAEQLGYGDADNSALIKSYHDQSRSSKAD